LECTDHCSPTKGGLGCFPGNIIPAGTAQPQRRRPALNLPGSNRELNAAEKEVGQAEADVVLIGRHDVEISGVNLLVLRIRRNLQ
jgi:hypothetical protein